MTIPECSIEKSASVLVDIFGDEAPARARERMDEYPQNVYKDGYGFWLAVANAATRLLEQERGKISQQSSLEYTSVPVSLHGSILRGDG